MRAVVQRVKEASLLSEGVPFSSIGKGLAVYIGFGPEDTDKEFQYMIDKVRGLRVFEDDAGKMNLSVADIGGEILWIPNFTLYGDCRTGRRPSYSFGAPAAAAREMFARFEQMAQAAGSCAFGVFQTDMQITQVNDGPVTLLIDSGRAF
ncbi:MAG: D-tyrosyl-tRNA(Tyr) deacylase [Firmicutes bacterium]|nr:D-tyrosyl-tRNA(Tyr) deacylase [Bacillota bacterium]MBQ5960376.1 D-tyrosyl-tRNA(Tyr) deacylase [Bacillota bacterium]